MDREKILSLVQDMESCVKRLNQELRCMNVARDNENDILDGLEVVLDNAIELRNLANKACIIAEDC